MLKEELRSFLSSRIGMGDIMEMVREIAAQPQLRDQLLVAARSDCRRTDLVPGT